MTLSSWYKDTLYLIVLFATLLVVVLSSGMIFPANEAINAFLHQSFRGVCHQQPWRSFSIEGLHMAVCSRCFGFYSGLFLTTTFIPVIKKSMSLTLRKSLFVLYFSILINFIDFSGNFAGIWTNTLTSRFIFGSFLSAGMILVIFSIYKPRNYARR